MFNFLCGGSCSWHGRGSSRNSMTHLVDVCLVWLCSDEGRSCRSMWVFARTVNALQVQRIGLGQSRAHTHAWTGDERDGCVHDGTKVPCPLFLHARSRQTYGELISIETPRRIKFMPSYFKFSMQLSHSGFVRHGVFIFNFFLKKTNLACIVYT